MNIAFIGAGYVGLVSSVMMSYLGHNVLCIDVDEHKIADLRNGKIPIYEPELVNYYQQAIYNGKIDFTTQYTDALKNVEAVFVAVGTPELASGAADLSYVQDAIQNLVKHISDDCVVIIKSTVPPGTCRTIATTLCNQGRNIYIVSNPEFLREGSAVYDFLHMDRLVIGTYNERGRNVLQAIYDPLQLIHQTTIVWTDLTTAELIKYAANALLATKIAFINEIANICEKVDANIEQATIGIGLDHRIGSYFLKVGPGFGGSCFPKDIKALSKLYKDNNTNCLILDAVIQANYQRPSDMVSKIASILDNTLTGKNITVLGLSFKAGTDDIRESPAIAIIKLLQEYGANVTAYDPLHYSVNKKNLQIKCVDSVESACDQAEALIITTEWLEFTKLDLEVIYNLMTTPIIIDLRNILNEEVCSQYKFTYYRIGKAYDK